MGCVYHPHRLAVAVCESCEADLCQSCAIRLEDGRILCHRCIVALSLRDVKDEAIRRRLHKEARRLGLERKWRPTYVQAVLALGALLVLMLVGLRLYWNEPVPQREILLEPSGPMSVLGNVQAALEHYALVHDGRYPDSLYALVPQYLDGAARNRRALRHLSYTLDEREGYVLRIEPDAPFPGSELVATPRGIRPSGSMAPGEETR
jgi:hypothetical protein